MWSVLVASLLVAQIAKPRFRGVVELAGRGVQYIDATGAECGTQFSVYGQHAKLCAGPARMFAVTANEEVAIYDGLKLLSVVGCGSGAHVIGWSGTRPIVGVGSRVYLLQAGSKVEWPSIVGEAGRAAGDPEHGYLIRLDHSGAPGDFQYGLLHHKTFSLIKTIGVNWADLSLCGGDVIVGTESYRDAADNLTSNGSLSLVSLIDGRVKPIAAHVGTSWNMSQVDDQGRYWVSETGYRGPKSRTVTLGMIYKYTPAEGLQKAAWFEGNFCAYGLDTTGKWIIGERIRSKKAGVYHLAAMNLETLEEIPILNGVKEFQRVE